MSSVWLPCLAANRVFGKPGSHTRTDERAGQHQRIEGADHAGNGGGGFRKYWTSHPNQGNLIITFGTIATRAGTLGLPYLGLAYLASAGLISDIFG
ncbi:hypothetical protein FJ934_14710 [Mesorhizobium sp. B2-4-12]|nr:hypothetical protein FJ934_14710 [Mesorhizobium sp. B2-4-12]